MSDYYANRFGLKVGIPGVFTFGIGTRSSTEVFYGAQVLIGFSKVVSVVEFFVLTFFFPESVTMQSLLAVTQEDITFLELVISTLLVGCPLALQLFHFLPSLSLPLPFGPHLHRHTHTSVPLFPHTHTHILFLSFLPTHSPSLSLPLHQYINLYLTLFSPLSQVMRWCSP